MTLHPLEGHEESRAALVRSFRSGRLPPVLLLHGPTGVGKQRFALWLGQLVLCDGPGEEGPCGRCQSCGLATKLEHPELHWYFPVPRPPARGSQEREQEALEEARFERLAALREAPLRASHAEEVQGLHLGTIRNLRREASRMPGVGSRRLFLIADAEELVSQESAPEAANALLKILEEPPADTWIVLTASEPGRLLSTVRSRATAMYVPPLATSRVLEFLLRGRGGDPAVLQKAAELSGGSIGRALGFLPVEGKKGEMKDGPLEKLRQDGYYLLDAALAPAATERFARALSFQSYGGRGLHELLTSLETWMRDLAVVAADADAPLLSFGKGDKLAKTAKERGVHPLDLARAIALVETARTQAAGNVNPQLLVTRLLSQIHEAVLPPRPSTPTARPG